MKRKTTIIAMFMAFFALITCPIIETFAGNGKSELPLSIPGEMKGKTTIPVTGDGKALFQLIDKEYNTDNPKQLKFMLTKFRGQDNLLVDIKCEGGTTICDVTQENPIVNLYIDCSEIKYGGQYAGVITAIDEEFRPRHYDIILERDRPAWYIKEVNDDQNTIVTVNENGKALISIKPGDISVKPSGKFKLTLSEFINPEGEAEVTFSSGDGVDPDPNKVETKETTQFEFKQNIATWGLNASQLEYGDPYVGTLTISDAANGDQIHQLRLRLQRKKIEKDAVLVAKLPPVTTKICWFGKCKPPTVDKIILQEQSGTHEIRGLSVKWGDTESEKDPRLKIDDLKIKLFLGSETELSDNEIIDLWVINTQNEEEIKKRTIRQGGKAKLQVELPKLPPGDHNVPIKLLSLNSKNSEGTEINIKATVQRPMIYPILTLIIAIVLSYWITNGFICYRNACALNNRIKELKRNRWIQEDRSNLYPIIRAKAVIARAREGLRRECKVKTLWKIPFSSAVIKETSKQIDQLEKQMPEIELLSELWDEWDSSSCPNMIRYRAKKRIRNIAMKLSDLNLQDQITDEIRQQIKDLKTWRDPQKRFEGYWQDLKTAIDEVKNNINLTDYEPNEAKIDSLKDKIENLKNIEVVSDLDSAKTDLESLSIYIRGKDSKAEKAIKNLLNNWIDSSWCEQIKGIDSGMNNFEELGIVPVINNLNALMETMNEFERIKEELSHQEITDAAQKKKLDEIMKIITKKLSEISTELTATIGKANSVRASQREIVRYLDQKLRTGDSPENEKEALYIDRHYYAPIKLILDNKATKHDKERLNKLITMIHEEPNIDKIFNQVDNWVWESLEDVSKNTIIRKIPEAENEAYEIINFEISPKTNTETHKISKSFAFNYGFIYRWTISFGESHETKTPTTMQPRVAQFIPIKNTEVTTSVEVFRCIEDSKNDKKPIKDIQPLIFQTQGNSFLRQLHWLFLHELLLLFVAFLVALFGAIETKEFRATLKGSWIAFGALFAFGVTADLLKTTITKFRESIKTE